MAARRDLAYTSVICTSTGVGPTVVSLDVTDLQWQTTSDDGHVSERMVSQLPPEPLTQEKRANHISYLELRVVFLVMKTFLPSQGSLAVLLRMDNITATTSLNQMDTDPSQHWQWNYGSDAYQEVRDPCRSPPRGGELHA
jgi:hypothetical protein